MIIKPARLWVPVLGVLALVALFLSLPEVPQVLIPFRCKTCSAGDPYLALVGGGYFAVLVALSLLFPAFPGRLVARAGLTWAMLLAVALIAVQWPAWCVACLVGHTCNVLMWAIWVLVPPAGNESAGLTAKERWCLVLLAPVCVMALFSSLNLTFMVYGFKAVRTSPTALRPGDEIPRFTVQTSGGRTLTNPDTAQAAGLVINFVWPNCPYCEEQLSVLNSVAVETSGPSYRFVNVSPTLAPELVEDAPATEWVEDRDGQLRALFQVSGSPTLFIVGTDGKIAEIIPGIPEDLESKLRASLVRPPSN